MKSAATVQIAFALDVLGAWGVWAALITAISVVIGAWISRPTPKTRVHHRPRNRTRQPSVPLTLRPQIEVGRGTSSGKGIITIMIEYPLVAHQSAPPVFLRTGKNVLILSIKRKSMTPTSISDTTQLEISLK